MVKLEVGKKYICRNGNVVGPLVPNNSDCPYERERHPFADESFHITWTDIGTYWWSLGSSISESPWDIVSVVEETTEEKVRLEEGKRYVLRDGRVTGPMHAKEHRTYNWWAGVEGFILSWTDDGKFRAWMDASAQDVVSEYVEAVEEPQLKEPQLKLKLEEGKRYVCRNGDVTTPLVWDDVGGKTDYPWDGSVDGRYKCWTVDGKLWLEESNIEHDFDLVAEYVEPASVDTGEGVPKGETKDDGLVVGLRLAYEEAIRAESIEEVRTKLRDIWITKEVELRNG